MHDITALCDVRSTPYSRLNPQFNREILKAYLRPFGIAYVFLGAELGARSDDPCCYNKGKIQYEQLAKTSLFQKGLERVLKGTEKYRLALMCAEKDPLNCHRTILVARHLECAGMTIQHINSEGKLESHPTAMRRLTRQLNLSENDIFRSENEILADAYRIQGERIAYILKKD